MAGYEEESFLVAGQHGMHTSKEVGKRRACLICLWQDVSLLHLWGVSRGDLTTDRGKRSEGHWKGFGLTGLEEC